MPASFEETLKATLIGVNDAFEQADADLHREVAAAAQSLVAVTEGAATLTLRKGSEAEEGIRYQLWVSGKEKEYEIANFFVSARGYPIEITFSTSLGATFGSTIKCDRKDGLAGYFSKLASNPDSTLITAVAYITRRK